MAILKLFWLGPPAIEYDDRPLRLEMRKTLALLAYLSFSPQSPTRETLATLFWPEYDQQHAFSSLRRSLSSLSKSLPYDLLITSRERIALRKSDRLAIDTDDFLEQLSYANRHSHPNNIICPDCLAWLEEAVSLYRGNFFEGFSLKDCPEFDEWQFFQREDLQSRYAGAIQKLAVYYASLGRWEKAISHTRSWVAIDRLNESARRMLISLLEQSGQPWAARRQSQELVRLLQEELDQEPEDETIELFRRLRVETHESRKAISEPLIIESAPIRSLEPLLKTKLYIPFPKGEKVFREQLVSKLNQIQEHALTILSAPAGYGKTTALSQWTKQTSLPIGWLALDDADNHMTRFLEYLVASLQSVASEIGEEVQSLLQPSQSIPVQAIAANLIHQFEKISVPFVLVLDDYQVIHTEPIHELLSFLLEHLPDNAHLVISTRADPPLNLSRLRVRGKLFEIRIQDLRLTLEEIRVFFNELLEIGISPDDIAILDKRTEGWAVGLQMAALSLQKSPDKSKAIQAFSGSNRYILDYLLEEVMERQPKPVQDFLLQTSILGNMNGSLCDAVTKIREWRVESDQILFGLQAPISSQQILEYLERSNLFILSLDDERYWYRYHMLFADLLKARLEYLDPQLIQSLHRRASEWYEQNGLIAAAARHALASKSFDYAAGVIERAIGSNLIWSSGDLALLLSWVEAMPEEVLFKNPLLRIYLCAALYVTGEFKKSCQILEELGKSLPEILKTVPNPVLTEQLFLNFCVLLEGTKGSISRAIEDSQRSRALASGDELANLLGMNYLLLAYLVAGDVDNALRTAHYSYEALSAKGFTLQALSNAKNTAEVYILQGRLTDAFDLCQQAIGQYRSIDERNPIAGILGFPIGAVLFERNELDMAENYVREGLNLLAKGPIRNDFGQGYALLAMIKQAQGDGKRALQLVDHALQIAEHAEVPRIIHLTQAYRAQIWLAQGDIDLASDWANAYQQIGPVEYPREIEDLALARVLIIQRRYAEAHDLLEGLRSKATAAGRYGRLIEILVPLSMVHFLENHIDAALNLLEESLRNACTERYIRVYVDKKETMRDLLKLYKDNRYAESEKSQLKVDEIKDYVNQLLFAFEGG